MRRLHCQIEIATLNTIHDISSIRFRRRIGGRGGTNRPDHPTTGRSRIASCRPAATVSALVIILIDCHSFELAFSFCCMFVG